MVRDSALNGMRWVRKRLRRVPWTPGPLGRPWTACTPRAAPAGSERPCRNRRGGRASTWAGRASRRRDRPRRPIRGPAAGTGQALAQCPTGETTGSTIRRRTGPPVHRRPGRAPPHRLEARLREACTRKRPGRPRPPSSRSPSHPFPKSIRAARTKDDRGGGPAGGVALGAVAGRLRSTPATTTEAPSSRRCWPFSPDPRHPCRETSPPSHLRSNASLDDSPTTAQANAGMTCGGSPAGRTIARVEPCLPQHGPRASSMPSSAGRAVLDRRDARVASRAGRRDLLWMA